MATDAYRFHQSVELGNFAQSREILNRVLNEEKVTDFLPALIPLTSSTWESRLKNRDHLFSALNALPIIAALQVSWRDLLLRLKDTGGLDEARHHLLNWTQEMFADGSPELVRRRLEFELISLNEYALLAGELIEYHANVLSRVEIPFSVLYQNQRTLTRYCLKSLLDTHYGEMALASIGIGRSQDVVGDDRWPDVKQVIEGLDLDSAHILVEVDSDDWQNMLLGFKPSDTLYPRYAMLEKLYQTRLMLKAGSNEKRQEAINAFADTPSVLLFDQIREVMMAGTATEKMQIIEVMQNMSAPRKDLEPLLAALLSDSDANVRRKAARMLSGLASRDFQQRADPNRTLSAAKSVEEQIIRLGGINESTLHLLKSHLHHYSPLVRLSVLRALRHLESDDIEGLVLQLMEDTDCRVRKAVVDSVDFVSWPTARTIIRRALQDNHVEVRRAASNKLAQQNMWPE
ncbi:hypothetical protein EU538_04915 [Candidatus Thorarchaeota archaeon]|nr:MAG: hypothetical protein EU538_04915 [Candidatus Thorarchaeota archaeon]